MDKETRAMFNAILEEMAVQFLIERGDCLEERLDGHEARIVRLEEKRKKPQKKFQEA